MLTRFTAAGRVAVTASVDEAALRGDRRIGTDHLLLGVLHDPGVVELLGVDLGRARDELRSLDRRALEALGIDIGDVVPSEPPRRKPSQGSSGYRAVLPRALALATEQRARRIGPQHLLLSLLERAAPDPAAVLLDALGVDREQVRAAARRA